MIDRFNDITTQMSPSMRGEVEFTVVDELTGEEIYSHKQSNMWFDQGLTNFINGHGVYMVLVNDEITEYTYKTTDISTGYVTNISPTRTYEEEYSRHKFGGVFQSADRTFNRIGLSYGSTGTSAYCCTTLTEPYVQLEGQIIYIYYYVYVDFGFSSGISKYEADRWKEFVPFQGKNSTCNGQNDTYGYYKNLIPTISNTKYVSPVDNYSVVAGGCSTDTNWPGTGLEISSTKYRRFIKNQSFGSSGDLSGYTSPAITGISVAYWGGVTKFSGKFIGRTWIKNRWSTADWFDSSIEAIPSGWWKSVNFRSVTDDDFHWKSSNKFSIYPLVSGGLGVSNYVYSTELNTLFLTAGEILNTGNPSGYGNGDNKNIEVMEKFGRTLVIKSARRTDSNDPSGYDTALSTVMYDLESDEYAAVGPMFGGGYICHDDGIAPKYLCQLCDAYPSTIDRYKFLIFEFEDDTDFWSDYTTHEVDTVDHKHPVHAQVIDYNGSAKILTQIPDLGSTQFQMIDMETKLWEDWWITDFGKQLGVNNNTNLVTWGSYHRPTDSIILVSTDCAQIMSIDGLTDVNNVVVDGVTGDVDLYSSYTCWSYLKNGGVGGSYTKDDTLNTLTLKSPIYSSSTVKSGGESTQTTSLCGFVMESGEFDVEIELDNIKPFLYGHIVGLSVMDTSDMYDESTTLDGMLPGRYIGFTTSSTETSTIGSTGGESFDVDVLTGDPIVDGSYVNPSTPDQATWTLDSGLMSGTTISMYHSDGAVTNGSTWKYLTDGGGRTNVIRFGVFDYTQYIHDNFGYISLDIPVQTEPLVLTLDYYLYIVNGNNYASNLTVYVDGTSMFDFRPSVYIDYGWKTTDGIPIPVGTQNITIRFGLDTNSYSDASGKYLIDNILFSSDFDYNSINEDISVYDFNVRGFDIDINETYDTINSFDTTLVNVTDIDITKPHGKLKVVRNVLDEIQTYYSMFNGITWSSWVEVNSGISSNVITGNALVAIYTNSGEVYQSFTTDLLKYTINSGTIDRKVLALPKMIESDDSFEPEIGQFEDPFSTSKDGMACYTDKNEIFVLYKYMCRVYDATTLELKRNEWFLPKGDTYKSTILDHDYNQAYIKFDDLDLSGDALGGVVLYSNSWPASYTTDYSYDRRSNVYKRLSGGQPLTSYFSICPVSGEVVDTSHNTPEFMYSSIAQKPEWITCVTPWNKQWIGAISYGSREFLSDHFIRLSKFNYTWDTELSSWKLVPNYVIGSDNVKVDMDYRLRDSEGYEIVETLITGKPTHSTFDSLHPFSADVQVRFNELTTSPSNTLSTDDYYTCYINQDSIANDNQQYVTGFSHLMYWTRAEKHNDVFTPASTHEVSETADIKFHSVDDGYPELYKLYYKNNTTDSYIYFDDILTFTVDETITTTDGGITLKIDSDQLAITYDYYKGKYLRYLGENRKILRFDDYNKTFELESSFTLTPSTGSGVTLSSEQPATLVTEFVGDNEFMLDDETGIITPSPAGVSHKVDFTYIAIYRTW